MALTLEGLRGPGLRQFCDENEATAAGLIVAGTGLTLTGATLTNDLSTGKAGGQTIYGGTAASENLTLSSTVHATKGQIRIGGVGGLVWDGANLRASIGVVGSVAGTDFAIGGGADVYLRLATDSVNWNVGAGAGASGDDIFHVSQVGVGTRLRILPTTGEVLLSTLAGSNSAAGTLTLASTTHATKGTIVIGTSSGLTVADGATPQVTIGTGTALSVRVLSVYNAGSNNIVELRNTGGIVMNANGSEIAFATTVAAKFGTTTNAAFVCANAGELKIGTGQATDVVFASQNLDRGRILSSGEWILSTSVAGSILAAGNLALKSTTHATKGQITLDSQLVAAKSVSTAPTTFGDTLAAVTGFPQQVEIGNTSGTSSLRVGQSASRNLGFTWVYNATPGNAIGRLDTYSYNNALEIDALTVSLQTNSLKDLNLCPATLATTAAVGFPRIPRCAGPPTGAAADGTLVIDETNLRLYVRVGAAWKSTLLA
jgi:hypothetical protein